MINMQLALGGGGGSGTPIGGVITIDTTDIIYTTTDDQVYLRTGFIESGPSVYPDVPASFGANLGVTYDVIDAPDGVCFDYVNNMYWVCTNDSQIITQYDLSWVATGVTKNIGMNPRGLHFDGVYFWAVSGMSLNFKRFDSDWVYDSITTDITAQDSKPRGITGDDTYLYVVGTELNNVYRYNKSTGVFVDILFNVSLYSDFPSDINIVNGKFWIVSRYNKDAIEFTMAGIATRRTFVTVKDTSGIVWNGSTGYVTQNNGTVRQISGEYVGQARIMLDGKVTKYVRVA